MHFMNSGLEENAYGTLPMDDLSLCYTHTHMHVCVREISNLSHPHQSLHILCRVSIGADGAAVRKTTGISSVID